MPRPTDRRKPEKLLSLPQVQKADAELSGQAVVMFAQPKGIDRYHVSSRIDTESAPKIRNLMFDDGVYTSRLGTDLMGGNAASIVMQVVDFVRKGQKKVTVRFCLRHIEIFEYGLGAWRSFPIPLTGSERDFFAFTGWADKLLFSNGVDGLWELDFRTLVIKLVPGGPSAKHLTTFGNRVVACSTVEGGADFPLRVRWTAKNDYTRWVESTVANPLTSDLVGGHEDLYGSPGGVTDEAIGVFPYSDEQAWLVRSHSVVQMSLSGNVLAPFRFSHIVAEIGSPYRQSVVHVPTGIVFASRDDIHLLTLGSFDRIGTLVMADIADEVETLNQSYAAYDVGRQEYRIAADRFVWRYRFVEKGWTADEYPYPIRALSRQIQGVAGIPIDNLPGIIDGLSAAFPPGAINDLVYDRAFDNAMMLVPESTELTVRENDQQQDTLLTGEETDSEIVLESGVLNLDALKAIELHGVHGEYEADMVQQLIFECSFTDGNAWLPYSLKDIEETLGSEMWFSKSERVSRKLRLRMRSLTLGKLRLLGLAPVLVSVERPMPTRKPKPATISILPNPLNLTVGGTQQLSWQILGSNGQPITGLALTFISSNSNIATVSANGVVRAIAPGNFAIVASVRNVQTSVPGTVTAAVPAPVASLVVTPSISQGAAGTQQQFTATLRDANGNILLGRTVVWATSNSAIAIVSSTGLVTLLTAGATVISATSEGVTTGSTLTVTASSAVVATVTVVPATFSGEVGDTIQLVAEPRDAGANLLSGKVITWSSDTPSVATVNATGLVSFVGAGSVTITATCETIPGTSAGTITVAVAPVATVTVTPSSFSKAPGQTQALTVVLKDSLGNVLTGRVITYVSSNTAIATVNSSGVVTAVAQGTATITASSEGKNGFSTATVTAVPVASVTVSPGTFSLAAGANQQLVATPLDALNNPLTGRVITWGSSNPTIATVSSTGLVTAVAVGSVTITATCETKSGTSSGTIGAGVYSALNAPASVEYNPRPHPAGMVAEMPRIRISTNFSAMALSYASTVTLTEQGSFAQNTAKLQQYIDEAAVRAGHSRINIANGVRADKPIVRFHTAGNYYTDICWPNLPLMDPNTRVAVGDMTSAPLLFAPGGGDSALQFDRKANNTRFQGIKFKAATTVTIYDLIFVSPREGGGVDYDNDINQIPVNIHFNQCLVEGNDAGNGLATGNVRNGVTLNARFGSLCNSYVHQVCALGTESHALIIYNTPGPIKVVNNYLEASSICMMIGGATPSYGLVAGRPADIEVRRNDMTRRMTWARDDGAWDGVTGREIKNCFESKNVIRLFLEGNHFHRSWADGQSGAILVIKSAVGSSLNIAEGNGSEDVTIRYNRLYDAPNCWNMYALADEQDAIPAKRASVYDNATYNIGNFAGQTAGLALQFEQNFDYLQFKHNTVICNSAPATFQLAYPNIANPSKNFTFSDNIAMFAYVWSDGVTGTPAIEQWSETATRVWERNVLILPDSGNWAQHPQGTNQFLTTVAGVGFVDLGNLDLNLAVGSPYKGDGEGGSDPGCNFADVQLATSGVVI